MLLDKLEQYNPVPIVSPANNIVINTVKLLEKGQRSFESDALYIGEISNLPPNIPDNSCANILCVYGKDFSLDSITDKENLEYNLIIINRDVGLIKLFNEIQDIMAVYRQWSEKLFDSLSAGKGLDELVQIGHELIGNPMHVFDTSFKVLAFTKDVEVDDPEWSTSQKNGYTSYKSVHKLINERYVEKVEKSKCPTPVPPIIHRYPAILSNITIDEKIVAQLAVLEYERPFKKSDTDLIALFANVVSLELQKNIFFQNVSGIGYEYFITDLLDGKIKNSRSIDERAKALSWHLKENFFVLTVTAEKHNLSNTPLIYLKNLAANLVSDSKAVLYYHHIVLVINTSRKEPFSEGSMNEFIEFLKANHLKCGISRCFHNLEDIREHYEQSAKAIELGIRMKRQDVLLNYEDYAVFHVLDILGAKSDLKKFCHPVIFELIEYDKKNNTNYTESLHIYLSKALDTAESAKALYIHYNTMRFRIEKIQTLMGIDLRDSRLLLHLHLSFMILDFTGELENIKSTDTWLAY